MHEDSPKEPGFQSFSTLIKIAVYFLFELLTNQHNFNRIQLCHSVNWKLAKKTQLKCYCISELCFSGHSVIFNEWKTLSCPWHLNSLKQIVIYVRHDNFPFKTIECQVYRKKSEIKKKYLWKTNINESHARKKNNFIVGKKKTTRFVICLNWLLKKIFLIQWKHREDRFWIEQLHFQVFWTGI